MLRLTIFIRKIIKKLSRKDRIDLNLAKSDIDTERLKADFEVLDRYQSFSSELLRLSLLGIGALAFLLKEVFTRAKSDEANPYVILIFSSPSITNLVSASVVFFAIAAACALGHRYYSSDAMTYHIRYLRLRNATPSVDLPAYEKQKGLVKDGRDSAFVLSGILIALSTIALSLGTVFLASALYSTLSTNNKVTVSAPPNNRLQPTPR